MPLRHAEHRRQRAQLAGVARHTSPPHAHPGRPRPLHRAVGRLRPPAPPRRLRRHLPADALRRARRAPPRRAHALARLHALHGRARRRGDDRRVWRAGALLRRQPAARDRDEPRVDRGRGRPQVGAGALRAERLVPLPRVRGRVRAPRGLGPHHHRAGGPGPPLRQRPAARVDGADDAPRGARDGVRRRRARRRVHPPRERARRGRERRARARATGARRSRRRASRWEPTPTFTRAP